MTGIAANIPQNKRENLRMFFSQKIITARMTRALSNNKEAAIRYAESVFNVVEKSEPDTTGRSLLDCTPESILDCVMAAIDMGLAIDAREHAWLIRYGDKAKLQIGYKGYVYKLTEFNPSVDVRTGIVLEGDKFEWGEENGKAWYKHQSADAFSDLDMKKLIGAYCFIMYTHDGERRALLERMPASEVEKVRSCAKTKTIWDKWGTEKAKVSVLRRAAKVKFAGVVEKLDAIDNDHYDLEQVTTPNKTEALQLKLEEEKKQFAIEAQESVEVPVIEIQEEIPTESTVIENTPPIKEKKLTWEGSLVTRRQKEPITGFPSALAASLRLAELISAEKIKADRKRLITDNLPLMNELVKAGLGDKVSDLHKLADGEFS